MNGRKAWLEEDLVVFIREKRAEKRGRRRGCVLVVSLLRGASWICSRSSKRLWSVFVNRYFGRVGRESTLVHYLRSPGIKKGSVSESMKCDISIAFLIPVKAPFPTGTLACNTYIRRFKSCQTL